MRPFSKIRILNHTDLSFLYKYLFMEILRIMGDPSDQLNEIFGKKMPNVDPKCSLSKVNNWILMKRSHLICIFRNICYMYMYALNHNICLYMLNWRKSYF